MLVFLLQVGNFKLDPTSYLFHKFITVVSTYTALSYVWWMVCGWMAWSGLLVLVVKRVGKFSLPEEGLTILFFVFLHYDCGFWYRLLHRKCEDSSSDLI